MWNDLSQLSLLKKGKSRCINPENPTGSKGNACRAIKGTGAQCAIDLGMGWKISPSLRIQPKATLILADIHAQGIIQSIWFGGDVSRDLILRFYWDDCDKPAVECPLPDFFGNGWMNNLNSPFKGPFYPLVSLPICINPNHSLNCYWPMPFRKGFRITLENRSERMFTTYYQINFSEEEVNDLAGYFYAHFRRTNPVPYKDTHIILDGVTGKGSYVGTALYIGLNGLGNWWGEGEVRFYIDGDNKYPTLCSTGTEDYVNGSYDWEVDGKYITYFTPYSGMIMAATGNGLYQPQERFAMYRWHLMDAIQFDQDIKVDIQDLGWLITGEKYMPRQDDIASVAYFYLDKPSLGNMKPLPSREGLLV
jgi:hypothetical protein